MKKLLALTMAGAMALSLAACGASSESTATSDSTATDATSTTTESAEGEQVTLNWAVWDLESTAYWQAMADGYMAANPNVTIEMTDLGSTDYMTQLATQLAGGNGELDVLTIKDIPGYSNLINLEMLVPMNDILERDTADFGGVIEQLTASDGNFYAVPFRSDFWVLFYNKDMFDQAGIEYPSNDMTFSEFDTLIREVAEKTGAYGNIYHTWRSDVTLFGILDGQNTIIDGSYDFLKPYYETVLAEQTDGVVPDYGELKTSGLHYSAAFENGQAAMCNMGSWFIATLQTYNSEAEANGVTPVNFGIVKYPHPDGVEAGTTLGTVTSLGINPYSENQEAAADFINWCVSDEGAAAIAATGTFPAVSNSEINDIIAATEGFPSDEASKEALTTTAVYLEMPLSDKASEIETVLNEEHDAIMTYSESVDEGIANMNSRVQEILNG
ncbi:sugar ABC transporter substrate-binding protein [Gemmiger formicilis]|uniref:ABC transporter substrate-binding protein n=1 Tax=Gemmiger formicilis TaxID=745368 RepID=UPI00195D2C73|nr:sugar ABC transporter substrate-binding protein [Gemmiger formicilis]MBM6717456.1 sugar ABC transporter substrate-binding protein [Gemmiger formicilis]